MRSHIAARTALRAHLLLTFSSLCVLSPDPASGQDATGFLSGSLGATYSYRAWTTESGLPQESVPAIAQTPDGYLWLGTYGGLARFNGVELRVFGVADHPQLAGNRIHSLHVDRQGALWIGHAQGSVSRFDGRGFTTYGRRHGIPRGFVKAIAEDLEGDLWFGAEGGLARRLGGTRTQLLRDESFETYTERDGLPARLVFSLTVGGDGVLWAGTSEGLARRADDGVFTMVEGVPGVAVYSLLEDPDGTLWLNCAQGLMRRYQGRWQTVVASPHSSAGRKLALDHEGQLWYSAYGSARLYRFSDNDRRAPLPVAGEIVELPRPALALFVDREGTLWAGTHSMGLRSLERQPVTRWTTEHGLTHPELRTVTGDGEGGLWVASGCEMPLSRWAAGTFHTHSMAGDLGCVGSFLRDRRGDLWIGAGGDLVHLRDGTEIARHTLVDSPGRVINAIFEDRDGRLWIGFLGFGLARFDRGGVRFYTRADGLVSDNVHFLAEDHEGVLWIGTGDGLSRFAGGRPPGGGPTKQRPGGELFENLTRDDGLPPGVVRAIHPDENGTLWIGTYGGGLGRLRDGRLTRITMRDGLYDNVITRILEDQRGNFWMLGNRGLSFVHRDQLNAFADGERDSVSSVSFGRVEGMTEGSGGRQPAGWRTEDGKMWFPTVDGLAMIDAGNFRINPVAPLVMIERVLAGRRELVPAPEVALDVGERNLEIDYAASSFAAPEKVRFRYRMDGYDDGWLNAGSRRTAYYTNLSPGTYSFRVTAANHHGVWNEEGAALRIHVPPPTWRTWWAYALYALALAGAVLGSLRWQQARVERERAIAERERAASDGLREANRLKDEFLAERERLIAELEARNAELALFNYTIAHDLKNPLVTILNYLGLARHDAAAGRTECLARDLDRLETAAGKLRRQLDELFELSRVGMQPNPYEEVAFGELVRAVAEELSELIVDGGIELEVAADLPSVHGDRPRLLEAVRHLLDNAIRHRDDRPEPTIEVGHQPEEGAEWILFVRDNGRGIDPRYHEKVFSLFERLDAQTEGTGIGLALVKRIFEVHGGRVWVESEGRDRGSTFYFTLPRTQVSA